MVSKTSIISSAATTTFRVENEWLTSTRSSTIMKMKGGAMANTVLTRDAAAMSPKSFFSRRTWPASQRIAERLLIVSSRGSV